MRPSRLLWPLLALCVSGATCVKPKEIAGRSLQAFKGVGEAYDRQVATWYDAQAAASRKAVLSQFSDCHTSAEQSFACWDAYDKRMAKANAVLATWRGGMLEAIRTAQEAAFAALKDMPDEAGQETDTMTATRTLLSVALQRAYEYLKAQGVPAEAP